MASSIPLPYCRDMTLYLLGTRNQLDKPICILYIDVAMATKYMILHQNVLTANLLIPSKHPLG